MMKVVAWMAVVGMPGLSLASAEESAARVQLRGELLWGADALGGAPYVFQDPTDPNRTVGFEVELAQAIAAKLGVRARQVQGPWDQLLSLLARGDFDVAVNGIELTDEKKRICAFSTPYFVSSERLTIRRGDDAAPRTLDALRNHAVGTLPGTLAEQILLRAGAHVKTYDGGQGEIYDDLRLRRISAVLLDEPIAKYYGEISPDLEVLDASFGKVSYAIAVRSSDESLLREMNRALALLNEDGTLRAIYERFGIWNTDTAALLQDTREARIPAPAPEFQRWLDTVGALPPFWQRVRDRYPRTMVIFARAATLTLALSIVSMLLAIPLGMGLALCRTHGPRAVRIAAVSYIEVIRGTPLLVQLIVVYFGLPELGLKLDPFAAGVIALGLNYAAAEAENYRAGIESVPASQQDAARVLGLSKLQALRYIVGPQALRIAIPPATNDFIALLKDSSLVSLVTLTELTKTYLTLANSTRDHLGLGLVVAVWYLLIGLPFARLARYAELRLGSHLQRSNA